VNRTSIEVGVMVTCVMLAIVINIENNVNREIKETRTRR
jgi:Flp pilus assembly pilin Flp